MTNSFDSGSRIIIFDQMKDAIEIVMGLLGIGLGFATIVLGVTIALFSAHCFIDAVCEVLK